MSAVFASVVQAHDERVVCVPMDSEAKPDLSLTALQHQCTPPGIVLMGLLPELMLNTLQYLSAEEAHALLTKPVCRVFRREAGGNVYLWRSLCMQPPWLLSGRQLDNTCMCGTDLVPAVQQQPSMCGAEACVVRGLRRKHSMLLKQMAKIREPGHSREAKVTQLCEIMTGWPAVVGIQLACFREVLPLLEAERVRKVAQDSALAHQVVSSLRNFDTHMELKQVALHALVLLARPIGGREGAVHIGMAPVLPALQGPRGGIHTVLQVMDMHVDVPAVQAMACWTLVNFALNAQSKALLLENDGVQRVLRAMRTHPGVLEVQFRGLFALINLVVPDQPNQRHSDVERIVDCVLTSMKSFIDHPMLINRACLVLQNLSLNELNYHTLRVSEVLQLLRLALDHHGHKDGMLRQSARATINRLHGDVQLPLPPPQTQEPSLGPSEAGGGVDQGVGASADLDTAEEHEADMMDVSDQPQDPPSTWPSSPAFLGLGPSESL